MDITELEDFKMSDAVKFHRNLNPELWTGTDLDPEVREQLIVIAEDFISYLGISDLDVQDITISGSNAAYSYTPHSDLDLHVIVDMSKLNNDAIYRELFNAKKTLYNDSHSITVHGVPVELYVQDANEPVKSLGEYSVLHDKWIHIPKKRRANFDEAATKAKFENLAEIVELALKTRDLERVEKTIDTIKRYRKAGLAKGGEFGPENLAFKAIRKQGGIQDLYDLRNRLRSDRLSIEEENKLLDKPEMSVAELAEKHGVSRMQIAQQLDKGIKVEMEHTSNKSAAREIALDHLAEDPAYYDKLAKVGLEEDSDHNMNLNEIGFADMLANLSLSDQEIIDNSTKAGTIGQTPVHIFKSGTSTLYFFATDTTILALVLLDRTYLKAIKNFTTEKGMVYSLLNYIVNIEGLHINIAPSEPFTQEGFNWLLRLANNTHGLRLSTTSGHTVDQAALKREWNNAKLTKEPGDTGLVISEMSDRWKSSIIENETSLMPFRIFEYTEILAEDPSYRVNEASGYIPSEKEKNDPRFKTALTADVKPDSIKQNAKAFNWKTSRAGIPPQANPNGKIAESKEFKAFVQYKENQFATEYDELMYIANVKEMDVTLKHNLLEALGRRFRSLSESAELDITDDDLKMLHRNYSVDKVSIGNRYIPVEIDRYHGYMILYDVNKNSPPTQSAAFATVTSISENSVSMTLDGDTYVYPLPHYGVVSASVTLFIDSVEKYNNLRTFMQLKFGQSLPPLADGKIAEDLMKEWKVFLAEDQEQQELFPGYDEKHRQERLNAWLGKSHAMAGKKPKVLYHATTKDFDRFRVQNQGWVSGSLFGNMQIDRTGIFLAENPKFAEEFIKNNGTGPEWKENAVIIPVYLSAQYPFSLLDDSLSPMLSDEATVEEFKAHDIDLWSIYRHFYEDKRWELFDGPEGEEFVRNLKVLGYDSAVMREEAHSHGGSEVVWVAFDPSQVKAITNRGSFSPDDPRMMRENSADISIISGRKLLKQYNGNIMKYDDLPEEAKESLTQWMIGEGDRPSYTRQKYGYVIVPTSDLIQLLDAQVGSKNDWNGKLSFRPSYSKTSVWPAIWGSEGFEDGWHRVERYIKIGLEFIPIVVVL